MADKAQENNENTTNEENSTKETAKAFGKGFKDGFVKTMKSAGPYIVTAVVAGVTGFLLANIPSSPDVDSPDVEPAE